MRLNGFSRLALAASLGLSGCAAYRTPTPSESYVPNRHVEPPRHSSEFNPYSGPEGFSDQPVAPQSPQTPLPEPPPIPPAKGISRVKSVSLLKDLGARLTGQHRPVGQSRAASCTDPKCTDGCTPACEEKKSCLARLFQRPSKADHCLSSKQKSCTTCGDAACGTNRPSTGFENCTPAAQAFLRGNSPFGNSGCENDGCGDGGCGNAGCGSAGGGSDSCSSGGPVHGHSFADSKNSNHTRQSPKSLLPNRQPNLAESLRDPFTDSQTHGPARTRDSYSGESAVNPFANPPGAAAPFDIPSPFDMPSTNAAEDFDTAVPLRADESVSRESLPLWPRLKSQPRLSETSHQTPLSVFPSLPPGMAAMSAAGQTDGDQWSSRPARVPQADVPLPRITARPQF